MGQDRESCSCKVLLTWAELQHVCNAARKAVLLPETQQQTSWLKKSKDEWSKKIIGGIVAFSVSLLLYLGGSLVHVSSTLRSELSNISEQDALAIGRNLLGSTVVSALPFRNVGENQQYIAVVDKPNGNIPLADMNVFLLRHEGNGFATQNLNLAIRDMDETELSSLFGVVDLHHDGKKQGFAVSEMAARGAISSR